MGRIISPANSSGVPSFVAVPGPCDLRCAFCNYLGDRSIPTPEDLAVASKELEALARRGLTEVGLGLYHSEPMTHPALEDIVARAGALGFADIVLATSGQRSAEPGTLRRLCVLGVTAVNVTLAGPDDELSDVLFGRRGATAAKLLTIENALAEGLRCFVNLAMLRPCLPGMRKAAELLAELGARFPGERLGVSAVLLDTVAEMPLSRSALLWPRFPELLWALGQVRQALPSTDLQAQHLPRCIARLAGAIAVHEKVPDGPSLRQADRFCTSCPERCDCMGMDIVLAALHDGMKGLTGPERPPELDVEELSARLAEVLVGSSRLVEVAAGVLARLASRNVQLVGFRVRDVSCDVHRATATLESGDERIEVIVEGADDAHRYYVRNRLHALSFRRCTPVDSEAKGRAMLALLEALERLGGC